MALYYNKTVNLVISSDMECIFLDSGSLSQAVEAHRVMIMSRLPHFLDSWLKDGGEVVSLMCRTPLIFHEDCWYLFVLEVESTPGPQCGWKDYHVN
jgi:hypothetical protein